MPRTVCHQAAPTPTTSSLLDQFLGLTIGEKLCAMRVLPPEFHGLCASDPELAAAFEQMYFAYESADVHYHRAFVRLFHHLSETATDS